MLISARPTRASPLQRRRLAPRRRHNGLIVLRQNQVASDWPSADSRQTRADGYDDGGSRYSGTYTTLGRHFIDTNNHADAVRYALLRKLAAGLRHRVMGDLQTIEFTAELCSRMVQSNRAAYDIRGQLDKISAHTGVAAASCHSMVEWLRPDDAAHAAFGELVEHCLRIAGDDWSMRGIAATIHASDECRNAIVSRPVVCELVVAGVLTLVDLRPGGLRRELDAKLVGGDVALDIRSAAAEDNGLPPLAPTYRRLDWDDVIVLARSHGVPCSCDRKHSSIALSFASV